MKKHPWFQLYPDHPSASRLSVIGGGVKLLSLFVLAAAILYTPALLLAGFRIVAAGGLGTTFLFLMDEMDEMVFGAFFLWGVFAICRYAACVLQAKAGLLARPAPDITQPRSEAPAVEAAPDAPAN